MSETADKTENVDVNDYENSIVGAVRAGDYERARALYRERSTPALSNWDACPYLLAYAHKDVQALARGDREFLPISWHDLHEAAPDLADHALSDLSKFQTRVRRGLKAIPEDLLPDGRTTVSGTPRIRDLPDERTFSVGRFYADEVSNVIAVEAQIVKRSSVDPKLESGLFVCQKCGHDMRVSQGYGAIREPYQCEGCEAKNPPFRLDKPLSEWTDHQRLRLQQLPEELSDGNTETVDAHLTGDLARRGLESGQRITLTAAYKAVSPRGSTVHDKLLDGLDVVTEESRVDIDPDEYRSELDELSARDDVVDVLAAAVAPDHYGDPHIKEGLLLQLVRGNSSPGESGQDLRGVIHQLLIGEPGAGKSNFGNWLTWISMRAKKASANEGTSAAGLTASLTRDSFGDADFSVTAGAIPQSSGGAIFIDELDKADTSTQNSMLEAMEDQVINIQKGGQEATLEADTAMLAAANPEDSSFRPGEPHIAQTDIDDALLDRFDLIFCPTEPTEEEKIENIAKHVVHIREAAARRNQDQPVPDSVLDDVESEVRQDILRAYLQEARELEPYPANETVREALWSWFVDAKTDLIAREREEDRIIPVTPRAMLDLMRLAEASAKLRHSEEIELVDVERATRLKSRSFAEMGLVDVGEEVVVEEDESGEQMVVSESPRTAVTELVEEQTMGGREYGAVREEVVEAAVANVDALADEEAAAEVVDELLEADVLERVDDRLVVSV